MASNRLRFVSDVEDDILTRVEAKNIVENETFWVYYPITSGNKVTRARIGPRCGLQRKNGNVWKSWTDGLRYLGIDDNTDARRATHLCYFAYGKADSLQEAANILAEQVEEARSARYFSV